MESSCESGECVCVNGCGCPGPKGPSNITISVSPTTGGQFDLAVPKTDSIENLKKLISKRLKVPKERICLLYRERQLRDGTVQENQLVDGSRLTLLPSVETGLLAQRPEQSVMQALESLNDSQVNDFLSGKAPLNLTMRLGDHMMLIQLQLSTVAPAGSSSSSSSSRSKSSCSSSTSNHHGSSSNSNSSSSSASSSSSSSPSSSPAKLGSMEVSGSSLLPSPTPSLPPSPTSLLPPTLPPPSHSIPSLPLPLANPSPLATASPTATDCRCSSSDITTHGKPAVLDTRALAEASRNLTQTLKQLSSEVLTSKSDHSDEGSGSKRRQGAIIESMHHHGKGVYSGTFSGTLNPALQDKFGRPKRDISTIIHILNDLLCATPQYRGVSSGLSIGDGKSNHHAVSGSSSVGPGSSSSPAHLNQSPLPDELTCSESLENRATRGKMERLRLVLGQRRERRRAMRSQPYSAPGSASAMSAGSGPAGAGPGPSDQPQPHQHVTA